MKKLFLVGALMIGLSSTASAGSDAHGIWVINDLVVRGTVFDSLNLDVDIGTEYLALNGGLKSGTTAWPASGTCVYKTLGGLYCAINSNIDVLILDLNPDASGSIYVFGPDGSELGSGSITLSRVD